MFDTFFGSLRLNAAVAYSGISTERLWKPVSPPYIEVGLSSL